MSPWCEVKYFMVSTKTVVWASYCVLCSFGRAILQGLVLAAIMPTFGSLFLYAAQCTHINLFYSHISGHFTPKPKLGEIILNFEVAQEDRGFYYSNNPCFKSYDLGVCFSANLAKLKALFLRWGKLCEWWFPGWQGSTGLHQYTPLSCLSYTHQFRGALNCISKLKRVWQVICLLLMISSFIYCTKKYRKKWVVVQKIQHTYLAVYKKTDIKIYGGVQRTSGTK